MIYTAIKIFVKIKTYTLGFYDYIEFSVSALMLISLGYQYRSLKY